jgi:hypothetical protein
VREGISRLLKLRKRGREYTSGGQSLSLPSYVPKAKSLNLSKCLCKEKTSGLHRVAVGIKNGRKRMKYGSTEHRAATDLPSFPHAEWKFTDRIESPRINKSRLNYHKK